MSFIIFGVHKSPIGTDELLAYCPSCESDKWADILVTSKYLHVYWIPIFPADKDLDIICKNCGLKRYGLPFNSKTIRNYDEIKRNYPHPWFTYLGIGVLILVILTTIIIEITKS